MKKYLTITKKLPAYTLIELTLYIAIFAVVITSITAIAIATSTQRVKNLVVSEVDAQGEAVMSLITQTARNSTAISTPSVGSTNPTMSLSTPTSSLNPTIFDSISDGVITRLRVQEGSPTTSNYLTNSKVSISALSFRNVAVTGARDSIQIQFTLTHYNPSGRNEFKYQKTFYGAASRR